METKEKQINNKKLRNLEKFSKILKSCTINLKL